MSHGVATLITMGVDARFPSAPAPENVVLEITIPGDPQSKARARVTQSGSYTPESTSAAQQTLAWNVRFAAKGSPDCTSVFGVAVGFYAKNWQQRDVDNLAKLVMDACTGIIWLDDAQVVELVAQLYRQDPSPRTELLIYRRERATQSAPRSGRSTNWRTQVRRAGGAR